MAEYMTAWPALPQVFGFGLGFLWLSLALGRRILRWCGGSQQASLAERGVLAAALGTGALQFIPFALGCVGLLKALPLRIAVAVVALASWRDAWAVLRCAAGAARASFRLPTWVKVWLIATAPFALVVGMSALAPTIDNDGLIYHLTLPKRWLSTGFMHYLPTYPYTNTPMGAESLFAIALVFAGDSAAKWLNVQAMLLGAAAVYLACTRLRGKVAGVAALTFLLLLFSTNGGMLGSAYVEGFIVLALASASFAWVLWLDDFQPTWLRCAALLAGIAVSFKITSAVFVIAMASLSLFAIARRARADESSWRAALAKTARVGPSLALLIGLPAVPWMVRTAVVTGNPFYPALSGVIPTRDLTPASASAFSRAMRYYNWGGGVSQSFQVRVLLLLAVALLLVAVAAIIVLRVRESLARAITFGVLIVALAQLAAVGLNSRLWMPLLAALSIPAFALLGRAASNRWASVLLIAGAALASAAEVRKVARDEPLLELARSFTSPQARYDFLLQRLPLVSLSEYANREIPADAHVLLSDCRTGFFFDRMTLSTNFIQDGLRLTSWAQFTEDVEKLGITHVVVHHERRHEIDSLIDRQHEFDLVRRLTIERGRLLTQASDMDLYAIDR